MKEENKLALIVAYYLSKFDRVAYENLNFGNLKETHKMVSEIIAVNRNTLKNMRDQFDPYHKNPRQGWHQRKLSISRRSVVSKYSSYTEPQMLDVVLDILNPSSQKQRIFTDVEQEEISEDDKNYIEGETVERKVLSYKRNKRIVDACKKRDNYTCQSCSFFHDNKIVECHHLEPLHMVKKSTIRLENLITLCPTCHRLAHALLRKDYARHIQKDFLIPSIKEALQAEA